MDADDRPAWFVGDLTDPWVAGIADRLPGAVERRQAERELPDAWLDGPVGPGLVVIHRPILTALDAQRVGRLRANPDRPTRVVLIHGPHVRHDDLGRWGRLFDDVIPEATAAETIRRRVGLAEPGPSRRGILTVISGLYDVRETLRLAARGAGYRVELAPDAVEVNPTGLIVWDVPSLDPRWPERMARRAKAGRVVAMIGFATRADVALARSSGASACLDWPTDLDDLGAVLDRLASRSAGAEPGHHVPPPPVGLPRSGVGRAATTVVDPGRSA